MAWLESSKLILGEHMASVEVVNVIYGNVRLVFRSMENID